MDGSLKLSDVTPPFGLQDEDDPGVAPQRVLLARKDGVWLIEAIGLEGVQAFGRTVPAAIANARKAIAAAVGESDTFDLVFEVDDEDVSAVLDRLREESRRNQEAALARRQAIEDAIDALRGFGMSYRDIGSVIDILSSGSPRSAPRAGE
jgi:polyribonucleotide nucleotidyltransferase